jgi:hypothetical protein
VAVFGRRQPHAPIILRGGQSQIPTGRVRVFGQGVHLGELPFGRGRRNVPVAQTSAAAADRYFRRSFTGIIIKRAGPPPAVARQVIVRARVTPQAARQRPFVSKVPPVAIVVTTPVADLFLFGQLASQAAARFFRRSFQPIIKRAGGQPAVARQLIIRVRAPLQPVRQRPFVSKPPPIAAVVTTPIGLALLFGQQASQAAARYYRRQFAPIIKRGGGRPALADQLLVRAQSAWRPVRRPILISQPPPPPVAITGPVGDYLVFGQLASQAAASRYFRRAFRPIIKQAGGRPAVNRQRTALVAVRAAADRYFRRSFTGILSKRGAPPLPPVPVLAAPCTIIDTLDFRRTQTDVLDFGRTQTDALDFPRTQTDALTFTRTIADALDFPRTQIDTLDC